MAYPKIINTTKMELEELYWGKGFSIERVADCLNTSVSTVHRNMVSFGIKRRSLSESIRLSKQGVLNPQWRGNNINPKSGRDRARRMYKLKPCRICGNPKSERHHIDADPLNNCPENIDYLCRFHHMQEDKRLFQREKGRFCNANLRI